MYVVIFEKNILYLGKSIKKTIEIFSKKNNAEIFRVNDIEELYKLIEDPNDYCENPVSETAQSLLKKLTGIEVGDITIEPLPTEKQLAKVACVGIQNKTIPPEFLVINEQGSNNGDNCDIREYLKNHDL